MQAPLWTQAATRLADVVESLEATAGVDQGACDPRDRQAPALHGVDAAGPLHHQARLRLSTSRVRDGDVHHFRACGHPYAPEAQRVETRDHGPRPAESQRAEQPFASRRRARVRQDHPGVQPLPGAAGQDALADGRSRQTGCHELVMGDDALAPAQQHVDDGGVERRA
ncbi:hypothetical protein GCM10025868_40790 [Angustibacter aerolatus]|uniref:Uncharacterized protein n=1 Tax=Angustibacter aerolatus TaxID=1162965 RepID=A0ABQ6JLQ9_9ACTN|nr:hypothetical protein [Angustibacter aerolatus]GMA88829.1 hypothetical protein GCM10025868_40790 [Angustibacter aerolatus]